MKSSYCVLALIGSHISGGGGVGTDFREADRHLLFPAIALVNVGCQREGGEKTEKGDIDEARERWPV